MPPLNEIKYVVEKHNSVTPSEAEVGGAIASRMDNPCPHT